MQQIQESFPKTPIVISQSAYHCLMLMAEVTASRNPDVSEQLFHELDRAEILPDHQLRPDIVQMGSLVEYQTEEEGPRIVKLVFPGEADISDGKISIMTPIGVALFGLTSGQSIDWTARDGKNHRLTVNWVK